MRTIFRQAMTFLLILLLSLCACRQEQSAVLDEPQISVDKGAVLDKTSCRIQEKQVEEPDVQPEQQVFSEEAKNSLLWLRDGMDFPQTMFGAAYLGYVEGAQEGSKADFHTRISEVQQTMFQAMMWKYPFMREINENHIIGSEGHLYCIVPIDENATVSINRVQWNAATRKDEVTEVLYRSETGEPVLLFANLDGVAYESDTQIFITDNSGNTCQWEPSMDGMSRLASCVTETGESMMFDFTEYGWQSFPVELAPWLADGWSGPTALGLTNADIIGSAWTVHTTAGDSGSFATFYLWFFTGDETGGQADLYWVYDDNTDVTQYDEVWNGFWTIQTILDGPSYVTLTLSLEGGKNYGVTDGPTYITETYPILISPSGEEMLIGKGTNNICLPFMKQYSTASSVLSLMENGQYTE